MGVPADDDGLGPAWHQTGNVLADDSLPEHGASEDITDGAVGRSPHLFKLELLHTLLVWCDGGTLDTHVVFLDRLGCLNRHLVICRISVLDAQVKAVWVKTENLKGPIL